MSLRKCFAPATLIVLLTAGHFDAHAQEGVTAVVTASGEIVYYSTATSTPPSPEASDPETPNFWAMMTDKSKIAKYSSELEAAVDKNVGIEDFLSRNPDFYVTTGYFDPAYTWNPETRDVEAAPAVASAHLAQVAWGGQLDTDAFLAKLADNLLSQTKQMACQIGVRPTTVEGTVSVGVVSFSANWDLGQLCEK